MFPQEATHWWLLLHVLHKPRRLQSALLEHGPWQAIRSTTMNTTSQVRGGERGETYEYKRHTLQAIRTCCTGGWCSRCRSSTAWRKEGWTQHTYASFVGRLV